VHWVAHEFTSIWLPIQLVAIALAAAIAWAIATFLRRRIDLVSLTMGWPVQARRIVRSLVDDAGTIIFALLVGTMRAAAVEATVPSRSVLLGVATSLATAWVVIHLVAGFIHNRFVFRLVAVSAWTLAALSILGLLGPITDALEGTAFVIGALRITPLLVIKTVVLLLLALWAAIAISDFVDRRLHRIAEFTPSMQELIAKLVRIALFTLAILLVVRSAGIDLSALAIFSGAVGVGIGFGLQKIVSNFVSGIILLADKSIKPGDVITVGDSYGWVSAMNTRCIAVVTRDGREVLIPNEDLVTQRVTNWSYSKDDIRLDVPFGVDILSDPHHVRQVAIAAVWGVPRVLPHPEPVCHFVSFDSRSLNFLLRFWINDPAGGITNVRSAVLLAIWDTFKREGIDIPSPIQEVRLREPIAQPHQ
jgi:small-conductance mechanosensitive channel